MIFCYNIIQLLLLPVLFIPLVLIILFVPKYRMHSFNRLGFGLKNRSGKVGSKVFWVHALSVGEVTSALPLVSGIRKTYPDCEIFFSASSRAGTEVAKKILSKQADHFIPFPFDFRVVVNHFLRRIRPDYFILVETDFWPNILSCMMRSGVKTILVNGRISDKSFQSYMRFRFFFRPIFSIFNTLCMQTAKDRNNLIRLGVDPGIIKTPGNLKFDTALYVSSPATQKLSYTLPPHRQLIVAGSTHAGEEEIILSSYKELRLRFPESYLIIAPRHPDEGSAIQHFARSIGLTANRRSQINCGTKDLFILDTIGELNSAYAHATLAFVGGSLIAKGGHNPIEPAVFSIPVLFGPHMEDFSEISAEMLAAGGAVTVNNAAELTEQLTLMLEDNELLKKTGEAARRCVLAGQGVIERHIKIIAQIP